MTRSDHSLDALLGQRLRLRQPRGGYRAGSDAVLLAAAAPARVDEVVLDMGCGVGAVALCLACRCPGVRVIGVDQQASLIDLARENAERNGLDDRIQFYEGRLQRLPSDMAAQSFDHIVTNPPFYQAGRVRHPTSDAKRQAHVEDELKLTDWLRLCLKRLKPGGSLSVVQRSERLADILSAIADGAGATAIYPLWPGVDQPAGRVIVQTVKGRRSPPRLLPGMIMHEADGRPTEMADAVLRNGAAIDLG